MNLKTKLSLAPMVRLGTLPLRLLSLKYGADLVFTPELIDHKLLLSTRIVNSTLNTIDYLDSSGSLSLRIHNSERNLLILQIGSSCPIRAATVAKMVANDVAGINLNCGCPKKFSTLGGMGAALLTSGNLIPILNSLQALNLGIPISCKIRILPSLQDTLKLINDIQNTGISSISIHFRFPDDRPSTPARYNYISPILEIAKIPIIINGDVSNSSIKLLKELGCDKFMLARGAYNPSIFNSLKFGIKEVAIEDIIREYIQLSRDFDMPYSNTKYNVGVIAGCLKYKVTLNGKLVWLGEAIASAKNIDDLENVFAVGNDSKKDKVKEIAITKEEALESPNKKPKVQEVNKAAENTM